MAEASIFVPITKIDAVKREVWGTLAEEALDKTQETFDYHGSKPYFQKWNEDFAKLTANLDVPSVGNLREMHTKSAAGKFISMVYDDDARRIQVGSKVVDDQAWEKCVQGVYTGFSIGGDYVKRYDDPTIKGAKRYIAKPTEGSLVDNPCMYGATFTMCKSDGESELVKFVGGGHLEKLVDVTNQLFKELGVGVTIGDTLNKGAHTKRVDNTDLHSSAFLIVGSEDDPSTWHLPVHFPTEEQTVNHIHAAMGRVGQVEGVSHQVKSGAARRLSSLASQHGIEVKNFDKFLKMLVDEEPSKPTEEAQITKGGGPTMSATATENKPGEQTPEQLKKGLEDANEALKKRDDLLAKANDRLTNLSKHIGSMRDAHEKMGDHVDAMCDHVDKAAGPLHKSVSSMKEAHGEMGKHLDDAEDCIGGPEKSAIPFLVKRMERGFEKRLAAQQEQSEKLIDAIVSRFEKMGKVQEPGTVAAPARTFVAPEKNADAAGVGGVILAKSAPAGGAPPVEDIPPVDAYGMPNAAYLEKIEKDGGSLEFVKAAAKVKLQSGNPFPSEFGKVQ